MAGMLNGLFAPKKPALIAAPTTAQSGAAATQAAAVAEQERTAAANAASAAASVAARGTTGRAQLLNNEVGLPGVPSTTVTQKTLGA
jgi:hypothetical protein